VHSVNWYHRGMAITASAIIGRGLARCGDLAIWAGGYQAALVVILAGCLGTTASFDAIAGVFLLAIAVYLLDRVKPTNAWWDPADVVAHPARAAFLRPHARVVRIAILVTSVASAAFLARVHVSLAIIVIVAHVGVLIYGTLPARPRVKDRFIIKNLAVAMSMSALAIVVLLPDGVSWRLCMTSIAGVGIVTADAMLCDIDDATADARFGTKTVPARLALRWTWWTATMLEFAAVCVIIAIHLRFGRVAPGSAAIITLLPITTGLLWAISPPRLRDLIDVRLPTLTIAVTLWSMAA